MSGTLLNSDLESFGEKELLGIWIAQTERAKFLAAGGDRTEEPWVQDVFIACVDGLKGFPEAIEAACPKHPCNCASCIWCATA